MKRFVSTLLVVLTLLSILVIPLSAFAEGEQKLNSFGLSRVDEEKPKAISIVYDDSGSMVNGNEKDSHKGLITRWAQAKYALEVFVSMLNDADELQVFTMSDAGKKPRLTISGADRKDAVSNIHNRFKTGDYGVVTPISTLDGAYKSLMKKNAKAYDRWLIVLTDGAFTGPDKKELKDKHAAEKKMQQYASSLNGQLIYIPIEISDSEYNYKNAAFTTLSKGGIQQNLLKAANQIYTKRDRIAKERFDLKSGTIKTGGISLSKLIVFLQGKNVKLTGLTSDKEGQKIDITQNIGVRYTEADSKAVQYISGAQPNKTFKGVTIKTDPSLNGTVAIVEAKDEGDYILSDSSLTLNYSDKAEISQGEIYYVPAVEMWYSLQDSSGNVWLSSEDAGQKGASFSPGDYTLYADIMDSGSGKKKLNNNPMLSKMEMDIGILGNHYSLEELQSGVPLHFESNTDLTQTTAEAYVKDRAYAVDTSDFLSAFGNAVVKTTYSLKVKIDKQKDKVDFGFQKVEFLLGELPKISKQEDMLHAIVSCYDESGKQVPITQDVWAKVAEAIQNGGSSADGTSISVGNPNNDKKTKVNYELQIDSKITADGSGVFYIKPKYILNRKGEPDRKHTTHRNFWPSNWKKTCKITAQINIPNVTETLAYSTNSTDAADKSAEYVISISVWWTIGAIIFLFWMLGYLVKRKLPKKKDRYLVNTRTYKKETDLRGAPTWTSHKRKENPQQRRIKVNKLSLIIPYMCQSGKLEIRDRLVLRFTAADHSRKNVILKNAPSEFKAFNNRSSRGTRYLSVGLDYLTTEAIEEEIKKRKKFIFNLDSSTITYGNRDGRFHKEFEIRKTRE